MFLINQSPKTIMDRNTNIYIYIICVFTHTYAKTSETQTQVELELYLELYLGQSVADYMSISHLSMNIHYYCELAPSKLN